MLSRQASFRASNLRRGSIDPCCSNILKSHRPDDLTNGHWNAFFRRLSAVALESFLETSPICNFEEWSHHMNTSMDSKLLFIYRRFDDKFPPNPYEFFEDVDLRCIVLTSETSVSSSASFVKCRQLFLVILGCQVALKITVSFLTKKTASVMTRCIWLAVDW